MDDDKPTLERLRALLSSGKLPRRSPDETWGGNGTGRETCLVCASIVAKTEAGIEAAYRSPDGEKKLLFFHARCFWAFESQRRSIASALPEGERSETSRSVD